ncbi:phosphoenolpyruvate hydrolase family protein [Terrisporobacter vanillatitrophus]|uniref:phosphoenolpyruvate hydrolase family protein n=1 Tax=Terrisporobacter vanillatitrophus TaxID=3058402 RepID=UPI003365EC6A
MKREETLEKLMLQIKKGNHIIGVATGSGMTAKYSQNAGADFLLTLSSARFRQMGRGSLASFLPYCNSNDMVMEFGSKEIIPLVKDIPVIFGVNATDPTKNMDTYLDKIIENGFSGVNNYPSIGLIDGKIREALEKSGCSYSLEVELIKKAHIKGIFTIAVVFDEIQAKQMIEAGADAICLHLGLTEEDLLGDRKKFSLEYVKLKMEKIFNSCNETNPSVIKLIYGGPIKTPLDVQYMYSNEDLMGYIGGSIFDKMPFEKAITKTIKSFKKSSNVEEDDLIVKKLDKITKNYNYIEFVKEYVAENYMNEISFLDLANSVHISRSYLSSLFKKEVGCSFTEYLVKFRINKAVNILNKKDIPLSTVASLVGYNDYSQFSKMFKKYKGYSPIKHKHKKLEHKNIYLKNEK